MNRGCDRREIVGDVARGLSAAEHEDTASLVRLLGALVAPAVGHGSREAPEHGIGRFEGMRLAWMDVSAFVRAAEFILEYPMVDRDPLPWWSDGRLTLLGDAAHPMYPRGSNGAGQAILDARALSEALSRHSDPRDALSAYEREP